MKKMKKRISCLLAICLAAVMALSLVPLRAEAAGASLSGASSLRSGESVTVTFSVSGSNIVAIQGTLSYDSSMLELRDTSCLLGGGWTMDMNGNTVVLYDSSLSSPIDSASVFSATFRVKSDVSSGSTVSASVSGISVSDGNSDTGLGSASWSATIAAPLSGNANLASLTCGNATLSPSFSADTTSYSTTVPFSVTYLDLHYSVADDGAYGWISGNDLSVGSNTVTVGVEAENGNTKYYNIYVTRQQDPNYKPSTNAKLDSLSPSNGRLSPSFSPDITEYVVYLPYEVESFSLSGTAQDGKALSVTDASAELKPGDNQVSVVCTAEDGKTKLTYTVHVYRMPVFAGVLPVIIDPDTADYKAVDEALEKVPADLSNYTDESVAALRQAVGAVVRNCSKDKQKDVDAMAKAIEDAIAALEEKPAPVVLTPWEQIVASAGERMDIPYLSRWTGPLPLKVVFIAALVLLALLIYLLGTLVGRFVGKRKALRTLAEKQPAGPVLTTEAGLEDTRIIAAPPEETAAAPAGETPAEEALAEGTPAEETPAEAAPVEDAPAETPVEDAPAEEAPAETPVENAPVEEIPAEDAPVEGVPAEAPVEDAPLEAAPAETAPVEEVAAAAAPAEVPVQPEARPEAAPEAPEDAPAGEAPAAEPETEAPAPAPEAVPEEDPISRMTLDELLEDIRNM